MKTKSLLKYGLVAMAALMMVACDNSSGGTNSDASSSSASSSNTNTATKKFKIGVSIPAADHGWTAGVKYWADEEAKKHPEIDFDIQTADSPDKQISQLEAMATKKIDALVILATESAPVTPAAKKLKDQGIFIVNVDRGFTDASIADIFLAGDNKKFGTMSAEFMADKLKGKGNILVLEGIPCTVNTDRVDAAKAVFAKYPGIKILASQSGMWNQQKAYDVMQTMLTANKQVDAIWAQDDDMALGAERALKQSGRDKGVWMLGGAGMKDIVKRVKDNDPMFPADVTYPPSMIADGIKAAVETLESKSKDELKNFKHEDREIKIDLVTPANASDFYFEKSVY
ncbi:MAG: ABC transporter substrate-binding protein [Armatimonadetes bacterium]|nr:ABC transporter substrate-binding protein [Armatimonadota bacterium]